MATGGLTEAHWDLIRRLIDWLRSISKSGGGAIPDDRCCGLARLDNECIYSLGDKSTFTCPEGYYKHWWYCLEGTRTFACGECNEGRNDCFEPDWACSIFWEVV
jgi:hypothetical protein